MEWLQKNNRQEKNVSHRCLKFEYLSLTCYNLHSDIKARFEVTSYGVFI